jgi:hypothetical protein
MIETAVSAVLRIVVETYHGIPPAKIARKMYGVRTKSKIVVAATIRKPNNDCWECGQ